MGEVRAVPCSVRSIDRGEALAATASQVLRWLVVEQPGPWGRNALLQSRLHQDIAGPLAARAKAAGVRAVLTRRPGWEQPDGPRRVHLASSRSGGGWVERIDLDDERRLLGLSLDVLDSPEAPGIGVAGPLPLLLVCTHGRHDACCANEGRPVVRALVEAGIPDVWEASHVGGDRFAANLVALPWGVYLGRLRAERAAAVATDLRAGLLDLESYRGRSCHAPMAQAADLAVRRATGERRVLAVRVEGLATTGENTGRVALSVEGQRWTAVVVRRRADAAALTCGAEPSRPWVHEVVDVHPA